MKFLGHTKSGGKNMLCKKCGAELPEGTENCIFCGADLAEAEVTPTPSQDTVYDENERKRREQIDRMIEEKKSQLSEIAERRNSKKQKKKRNKILIACVIIALLAAGAGIAAYYIKDMIDAQKVETVSTPMPSPTIAVSPAPTPEPTPTIEVATPEPGSTIAPEMNAAAANQTWESTGNSGTGVATVTEDAPAPVVTAKPKATKKPAVKATAKPTAKPTPKPTVTLANTGVTSKAFGGDVVKGGKVLYNDATGKYLMTFVSNNTRYYANVSAGSTTEQINGRLLEITAAPTAELYDGNTIYEISAMKDYAGKSYIISDSDTRLLTDKDIAGLSKEQLALARNEIYARHGRKFKTAVYNNYFSSCGWYSVNPNYNYSDDNSNLNEIEVKNVNFILKAEKR